MKIVAEIELQFVRALRQKSSTKLRAANKEPHVRAMFRATAGRQKSARDRSKTSSKTPSASKLCSAGRRNRFGSHFGTKIDRKSTEISRKSTRISTFSTQIGRRGSFWPPRWPSWVDLGSIELPWRTCGIDAGSIGPPRGPPQSLFCGNEHPVETPASILAGSSVLSRQNARSCRAAVPGAPQIPLANSLLDN